VVRYDAVRLASELGGQPLRWIESKADVRRFVVERDGHGVPGLLCTPSDLPGPFSLILAGHGYTMNKRALYPLSLVDDLVSGRGFAVATIDAPGHGDRQPDGGRDTGAVDRAWRAHWRQFGGTEIAADWRAVLDELQDLPELDGSPVGYWGLSLGTHSGLAFLAVEHRIKAAVLGLSVLPDPGPRIRSYAQRVSCPVFFIQQQADEIAPLERSQALFECLASEEKTLRSSPGAHAQVPGKVLEEACVFLAEHLRAE